MTAETEKLIERLLKPMLRLARELAKNKANRLERYKQLEELARELTDVLPVDKQRDLLDATLTFVALQVRRDRWAQRKAEQAMQALLQEHSQQSNIRLEG